MPPRPARAQSHKEKDASSTIRVVSTCVMGCILVYTLAIHRSMHIRTSIERLSYMNRRELVAAEATRAPLRVPDPVDLPTLVKQLSTMPTDLPRKCHARPHSDYAGSVAGQAPAGDKFLKASATECCEACFAHTTAPKCNEWVYNTVTKACWMKNVAQYPERPYVTAIADSPWTAGSVFDYGTAYVDVPGVETCVHTVATSNGNDYSNYQTRVLYQTWKRVAEADGPNTMMRKFTRLLHRGADDDLMAEIPTVRVNPARPECDHGCDFVVADRSQALLEWSRMADSGTCSHVLVIETDYLFVKPVRRELLPSKGNSVGFHFGYVNPAYEKNVAIARRYWPEEKGGLDLVPQTGNAPQLQTVADFRAIAPLFRNFTVRIEADNEAREAWGWVRCVVQDCLSAHHPPSDARVCRSATCTHSRLPPRTLACVIMSHWCLPTRSWCSRLLT
jgi:hypothetical protein